MKILNIETSCDDTSISILEAKGGFTNASFRVLADSSNSQIKIHIPYGGVFPALAKKEHTKNLPILLENVLKESKLDKLDKKNKSPVDAVAVTYGPGLEMSLWTGITFAKELAEKWKCPLIPVNHMEGHVLSVFGKNNEKNSGKFKIPKVKLPMLSLLVSGGHTQLIVVKKWMQYEIIGETVDDAVGEAFDKVARMLGLPYPGGPEISKLAGKERTKLEESNNFSGPRIPGSLPQPDHEKLLNPSRVDPEKTSFPFSLPRPMLHSKNFNFSFSGLKTAVLYLVRDMGGVEKLSEETKQKIALEFENAAIECLVYKTAKAIEEYKIKTLIVAGGVAANKYLKSEMEKLASKKIKLFFPTKEFSGDNSLMIGIAGYLNYIKNKKKVPKIDNIKATGNLRL